MNGNKITLPDGREGTFVEEKCTFEMDETCNRAIKFTDGTLEFPHFNICMCCLLSKINNNIKKLVKKGE